MDYGPGDLGIITCDRKCFNSLRKLDDWTVIKLDDPSRPKEKKRPHAQQDGFILVPTKELANYRDLINTICQNQQPGVFKDVKNLLNTLQLCEPGPSQETTPPKVEVEK